MSEDVLASVGASTPRRVMGVMMLATVGVFSVYIAGAGSPDFGWTLFLVGVGAGALWLAQRMWRATRHRIELTEQGLRSSDGTEIARIDEIEVLDRGFMAFKPSNGFVLRLSSVHGRNWQPGLWWRLGRRVGIGGVTPGSQSKAMSEILAALIARKEMKPPDQL